MDIVLSLLLGVVEGLTEFLPISSTGHLLIASSLLERVFTPSFLSNAATRITFDIFIQFGAVLAVLLYYARDLIQQARSLPTDRGTQKLWLNLFIAFLPAALIGLLLEKQIDQALETPLVIGVTLIVGGLIFLWIEREPREFKVSTLQGISTAQALWIGIAQITALIPGISRSGATIVGGLLVGLDRLTATTFSFYLFIPTLGMASLYKLFSALRQQLIDPAALPIFVIGTVAAFFVSYASIAWLLRFVSSHNFRAFGFYRIAAGILVIVLALLVLR